MLPNLRNFRHPTGNFSYTQIPLTEWNTIMGTIHTPSADKDYTPVTALQSPDVPLDSFLCNFDPANPEYTRVLFAAAQPTQFQADDHVGKTFPMMFWVCRKMRINGRAGEGMVDVVRTVLIGPKLETLGTMSTGIMRSIELFRQQFGDELYNPAINVIVKSADVGKGGDMLFLYPADAADVKQPPA